MADFMSYLAGQKEICPDTGRTHWQLYVETTKKIAAHSVKRGKRGGLELKLCTHWEVVGCHTKIARSVKALKDYVEKAETAVEGTWFEEGTPMKAGSDASEVATRILAGATPLEVMAENPANLMYLRNAQALAAMMPPPFVERDVRLYFLYGVSGGGKSHRAREIMQAAGEEVCVPCGFERGFFSGPIGSRNCVYLEDLSPEDIPHTTLLRLCDKWVPQLNVKGGATYCIATTIIITSNYHPMLFDKAPMYPLARRFQDYGTVEHFPTRYVPTEQ